MKVLTSEQSRAVDLATCREQKISSLELMERAGTRLTELCILELDADTEVIIACGPGNNGGDGLVMARLLAQRMFNVTIWDMSGPNGRSPDNQVNFDNLPKYQNIKKLEIKDPEELVVPLHPRTVIIDALFGSGLNRPLEGYFATCVKKINASASNVISIDLPSGLMSADPPEGDIIRADLTLTIGNPKLNCFLMECAEYIGRWRVVDIGLSTAAIEACDCNEHFMQAVDLDFKQLQKAEFSHKGDFGHGLIIAGSSGMIGAALLCAKAAMRSGIGKITVHIPSIGKDIVHMTCPEVMVSEDEHDYYFSNLPDISNYNVIGIGCGLGQKLSSVQGIDRLLSTKTPALVLDADALNIIAANHWVERIPVRSVLTPHPREFDRLFGASHSSYERLSKLKEAAKRLGCTIVLKGKYTRIATPNGKLYFNSSGNSGLASAGSGDVLTGIITSLLGQLQNAEAAAKLGVYIHGRSADIAVSGRGKLSLIASDIISNICSVYHELGI